MKSSPIETFAELSSATGAIHTFAGSPMFIYISIGLVAVICALLVVKSYMTRH
ncbi:MAG TPA: hypothetical protein VIM61_03705 [Chthoniobacterales bacterium]|jgi:hypothetical protein